MKILLGLKAALLGASLMVGGAAGAATCDTAYSTAVTGNGSDANSGCFLGSTNNDTLNPLQVNTDAAFGSKDWAYAGKLLETEDGNVSIGAVLGDNSGTFDGTWSVIPTLFSMYDELMIVLKGGNGNIDPDTYVAYRITEADGTSGSYVSPFFNVDRKTGEPKEQADISHISFYVRGDGVPGAVPLPAGMPLLLAGMGAMALLARRKTRKA